MLSSNRLHRIPSDLPVGLKALYMSGNWLCELPTWMATRLPALELLDVHMNNVLFVHRDTFDMQSLRVFAIAQNPVLQGHGRLASALREGQSVPLLRLLVHGMTATDWAVELESLRKLGRH